jgi:hypothetical protein
MQYRPAIKAIVDRLKSRPGAGHRLVTQPHGQQSLDRSRADPRGARERPAGARRKPWHPDVKARQDGPDVSAIECASVTPGALDDEAAKAAAELVLRDRAGGDREPMRAEARS